MLVEGVIVLSWELASPLAAKRLLKLLIKRQSILHLKVDLLLSLDRRVMTASAPANVVFENILPME
jgi:hypothetical protein